jgi:hypothetical protein
VHELALGEVSLPVLRFFPVGIIVPHVLRTHAHFDITLISEDLTPHRKAMPFRISQEERGQGWGGRHGWKITFRDKIQASELRKSIPNSKEAKAGSLLIGSIFFPNSTINDQNDDAHFINFRFSPCIIIVNHFYCPTNELNYTKRRVLNLCCIKL